jgi:hypothetical protein
MLHGVCLPIRTARFHIHPAPAGQIKPNRIRLIGAGGCLATAVPTKKHPVPECIFALFYNDIIAADFFYPPARSLFFAAFYPPEEIIASAPEPGRRIQFNRR